MATDRKIVKNTTTMVRGRGQLVYTGRNWSVRFIRGAKLIPLGTADKTIARMRADQLLAAAPEAPHRGPETFKSACIRVVEYLATQGMRTADERLARLKTYAWPALGRMPVTEIRSGQISEVLEAAAKRGLGAVTIGHLRVDMSKVFADLVRDEILESNPARAERVRTPTVVTDKRKRVLLTDEEFTRFIGCAAAPLVLRVMAVVSRCFGGLRPSDLYALCWTDIDLAGWVWADAPRPKTEHHDKGERARERLELPSLVRDWLQGWWLTAGRPAAGAVFPTRIQNVARDLRRALMLAGVDRHEVHNDTDRSLRTDFYSFRRAFVTAVAASGVNAQVGMRLSGHRSMSTHQRYHLPSALGIPASVSPTVVPESTPAVDFDTALADWSDENHNSVVKTGLFEFSIQEEFFRDYAQRPQRDLNPCYRRERPGSDPAQNIPPCQEKTKLSWGGAVLRDLFGGPE